MNEAERRRVAMEQRLGELESTSPDKAFYDGLLERALLQAALGDRDGFEATMQCRNRKLQALRHVLEPVGELLLEAAAGEPPAAPSTVSSVAGLLGKGGPTDAQQLTRELLGRIKESHPDTFENPNLTIDELRARAIALANQHVALLQSLKTSL
jgi:hypothetical protein